MRISWDSRRQPGERVIGIWLLLEGENGHNNENGVRLNLEPVLRVKGGRKYKIITREYMADGHDGYEALRGSRQLIDHESGDLMSSIVRRYLLGVCDNVVTNTRLNDGFRFPFREQDDTLEGSFSTHSVPNKGRHF